MNNFWQDFKLRFLKGGSPAMRYIGINVVVFVLVMLASIICYFAGARGLVDVVVTDFFAFPSNPEMWLTRFYTVITYQFFHADFFHILFNLLWLYWMGQLFLDFLKPRQFHFVYLGGGIAGALFFALIFNLVPSFETAAASATLIGSSAAVMAIFAAVATLVPDYQLRLLIFGDVKLKWLLLFYVILDVFATAQASFNVGGSLSHLGGALFGFIYIKLLQNGTDLSSLFEAKPKMKVVRNNPQPKKQGVMANQQEIDAILDKISKSGYENLSTKEKQILFDASKH